jgi:hypothetical protein
MILDIHFLHLLALTVILLKPSPLTFLELFASGKNTKIKFSKEIENMKFKRQSSIFETLYKKINLPFPKNLPTLSLQSESFYKKKK